MACHRKGFDFGISQGHRGLEHVRQITIKITIKTRLQYPWNLWTKA
jgi:hypothetical protein